MSTAHHLDTKTINIIYVEDNPGDQQLLVEQLSLADDEHFRVRLAMDLAEAHTLYSEYSADLLLIDLNLADTKEHETIDVAVRSFPGVPILILSQSRNLDISYYAFSQGVVDFLVQEDALHTEKLVRAILMAKVRWEVEQEKIGMIQSNLQESLALLERSRQLLSEQIFVFSHKIRGPLCTIEGLVNLLEVETEVNQPYILEGLRNTHFRLKEEVDKTISNLEDQVYEKLKENN